LIIKLLQHIELQNELQNPGAARIHIICDNARYYHAQLVKDYLANSRIELVFLPPYAPNLNLIERFWKFFKKTILYERYYETFCQFKTACDNFFAGLDQHHASLRPLLTDRFQIISLECQNLQCGGYNLIKHQQSIQLVSAPPLPK